MPVCELTGKVRRYPGILASWPNVDRNGQGGVIAFGGLSLAPAEHSFEVGGQQLFSSRAWDTLFLPALLERPAEVRSTCPLTAIPVVETFCCRVHFIAGQGMAKRGRESG
jgi:alkylmercury lyase